MSDVMPTKQTVLKCLRNRSYDIDFYQREYVWDKETVEILLDDIMYAFELSYDEHENEDFSPALVDRLNWYYLNVFITNNVNGKTYIVDGQQRLSTLTLIAVYLYHNVSDSNICGPLGECIASTDMFSGSIYNIDHEKRKRVMDAVFHDQPFPDNYSSQTEETIIERYKDISEYFKKLNFDDKKLKVFSAYFLNRLVLVELTIEKDDTPMVFEVINDRGEALKPFEILKGKLIGLLDSADHGSYNTLWEEAMRNIPKEEDAFFVDYLKSRFIFKRNSEKENSINNEYHRYLFGKNDIADVMGFGRQTINANLKVSHLSSKR